MIVLAPTSGLSCTTRKSSKATWVNWGLPAHSPIAPAPAARVVRCSSTAMYPFSRDEGSTVHLRTQIRSVDGGHDPPTSFRSATAVR